MEPVKEVLVEEGIVVGQRLSQSGETSCRNLFQSCLVSLVPVSNLIKIVMTRGEVKNSIHLRLNIVRFSQPLNSSQLNLTCNQDFCSNRNQVFDFMFLCFTVFV